ncbi:phosphonate C-P lyase system protein PhnG [Solibacillus cecembensis]|uniref:phosphonate C-P lyase system protein PhnG n=1 Tax=Solibacillus cecembensis TaxID=459347 RepID=UPI003CFD4251
MKRKKRMRILIDGSREVAKKLASQIEESYDVEIIMQPQEALTMIKMRESAKKTQFYLGEVLVTECKVQVNNQGGIGIVVGLDEELAYQLAIIDAAFEANLIEIQSWLPLLEAEELNLKTRLKAEEDNIYKTKVQFETMDV